MKRIRDYLRDFLPFWIPVGVAVIVAVSVSHAQVKPPPPPVSAAPPAPQHALYWPYPTNAFSADLMFNFYSTTNVALPQPWTLFGSVSATNLIWTNLDSTGTNALLSWPLPPLVPGQYFFYAVPSNFWLVAPPSNTAQTPPFTPLSQFALNIR